MAYVNFQLKYNCLIFIFTAFRLTGDELLYQLIIEPNSLPVERMIGQCYEMMGPSPSL